ncbi:unnamed protein product [Symbiodinium sp. CCMP2592]|nr:unnamed protein product [Symbiodinium sp. CCMP2592]
MRHSVSRLQGPGHPQHPHLRRHHLHQDRPSEGSRAVSAPRRERFSRSCSRFRWPRGRFRRPKSRTSCSGGTLTKTQVALRRPGKETGWTLLGGPDFQKL